MKRAPQPLPFKFVWNEPGRIAGQFVASDALLCGIRGPYGSGKSTACIAKLLRNFAQQTPGPDGLVHRRTAIIRNDYPKLATTTIKTWHEWVPKHIGRWVDKGPPAHYIEVNDKERKGTWEVIFLALDTLSDLDKLLSMDLSDAWINEAREIPKAILDGLTGRVGRYPRTVKDAQGNVLHTCNAPQIVMDTNSPDTDHWWAKMADFIDPEMEARNREIEEQLRALGTLRPNQPLDTFFAQPGGRTPKAENLQNLYPGYYERLMAGKSDDWIKVYVDGEYGFVQEGKPVYPEYKDAVHCREFTLNKALPLYIGIDFGLTPAATIGQRRVDGAWRIHSEIVTEDMGALEFGRLLKQTIQERYGNHMIAAITGDPAGDSRAQTDASTPFQVLKASGIVAQPATTNDPMKRRETFASFLMRMMDGEPGMLIHPQCQRLRKALAGGYHYRRIEVVGEERYHDQPVKDMSSHVAEAAQYMLLGAGEAATILRPAPELRRNRPQYATMDYDVLNWRR